MEKRLLIQRWLGSDSQPLPIYDEASVSSARERVREAGRQWNASKELVESVALIASELTHNQLKHAKQGYFAVRTVERGGAKGLEVQAADLGPGMSKPVVPPSTDPSGSLRAGIAAVFRMADEVEVDSRVDEGACIVARKFEGTTPRSSEVAILGRPYPGEGISGDDGVFFTSAEGVLAAVCDGLGHGPEARMASHRAIEVVKEHRGRALDEIVNFVNAEMSSTRGCALSLVRFDAIKREVECVAAGDVSVQLYNLRESYFFPAAPFVLRGTELPKRRLRVERMPVEAGSVLVMFTDGLSSRTHLKSRLDLLRQSPAAIAQHLLEVEGRLNDDAMVLVAKLR